MHLVSLRGCSFSGHVGVHRFGVSELNSLHCINDSLQIDPACGTFGFMIAASNFVREQTDDFFDLDEETAEFEYTQAFTGCELVHDTHRLALMNAMLHDIQSKIILGDTLSNVGKEMQGYDVVLTNPPFGTKKGGERATRDDFTYPTSNKQLNFLQHIYRSLKADGKARAAVVLPDNVLLPTVTAKGFVSI